MGEARLNLIKCIAGARRECPARARPAIAMTPSLGLPAMFLAEGERDLILYETCVARRVVGRRIRRDLA